MRSGEDVKMLTTKTVDSLVVGAGIFGITSALELKARGYHGAVLDPGPLPHPLAASTDISKVVRMEYGSDEGYMALVEQAYQGWLHWNEELGETLFHDVGLTILTRAPMSPGKFEYESYHLLRKRGHEPERLTAVSISRRFPAWKPGAFVDGFSGARRVRGEWPRGSCSRSACPGKRSHAVSRSDSRCLDHRRPSGERGTHSCREHLSC